MYSTCIYNTQCTSVWLCRHLPYMYVQPEYPQIIELAVGEGTVNQMCNSLSIMKRLSTRWQQLLCFPSPVHFTSMELANVWGSFVFTM